jgi:hypothetical protein
MLIKKKTWPGYFADVAEGKKKFDLRLNDFSVKEGDALLLEEWDPQTKNYTGRKIEKRVTHVARFAIDKMFWPKEEIITKGFQVISFE